MTNKNIIITKPSSGTSLTSSDVVIDETVISPFDQVVFNVAVVGIDSPTAVYMDFKFADETTITNQYMFNSSASINKFSLDVSSNFASHMSNSTYSNVTITNICIITETDTYNFSSDFTVTLALYKSNANSPVISDIQKVHMELNRLYKEIEELKNK